MGKKVENSFIECDDYAEIVIHSKKHGDYHFKIDKEDVDKCKKLHWRLSRFKTKSDTGFYCVSGDTGKVTLLHRYIMDTPDNMCVDHINGKTTDNRKANLRNCTKADNNKNLKLGYRNTSGHKGVYYNKKVKKWLAAIGVDGKLINLGFFTEKEDAIKVREESEIKYFGRFNANR